jgi:hypothetical protein
MTAHVEVATARDEVERTRAHISDTIDEIETRLIAPVKAVQQRLDVMQLVRDHPWPALATAIGVGVAVSVSRADVKAATMAKEKAIDAGTAAARAARELPTTARGAAAGAKRAAASYVDSLASTLLLAFIDRVREPDSTPAPTPPTTTTT